MRGRNMFKRRTPCTCLCIFGVTPIHEYRMQQAPHVRSEGWPVKSFCVRSILTVVAAGAKSSKAGAGAGMSVGWGTAGRIAGLYEAT